jgi:hypothetical protein
MPSQRARFDVAAAGRRFGAARPADSFSIHGQHYFPIAPLLRAQGGGSNSPRRFAIESVATMKTAASGGNAVLRAATE